MKWTFPNLRLFLSLAVITGGIYPLVVTLVSLIFFPHQAHGSLIRNERGEIIASELVAQPFISAKYFWPRPSAGEYATMPSGASNLSWTSGKLV
ncbi:MAG: potassium-transporting ATPase subunit C, partial [Akkermansia sp.]|nr:potassium-transporting ATPase subunit C [Akkermansia sp.]MBP9971642.1 potassium-transporting ATPase subunit C [Akkermansia sp.]